MQPLTRSRPRPRFFGTSGPSFALDFVNGTNALDTRVTFTRASSATYFDSAGVLQSAANDVPRFDYNPATLAAQGLLIEEQRTNSIRNSTGVGAVAGTPGTNPTNWSVASTIDGLTKEIVGVGTQNGIDYIDIRWYGTSGTAAGNNIVFFEPNTQVVASNTQTWTSSAWAALVGGSLANVISIGLFQRFNNSGGSQLTASSASLLSITSSMQRFGVTLQANDATTAHVTSFINANFTDNSAVDITLRIGLPQLELGAFATSVIPTTTTALTRSADVASVTTLSPWFNATEGTLYSEFVWEGLKSVAGQRITVIDDGSTSNYWALLATSTNAMQGAVVVSGTTEAVNSTPSTTYTANTLYKQTLALELNNSVSAINGTTGSADTSVSVPQGLTTLRLGASSATTTSALWFRRITYYNTRLPDAQLQALTAP